MSLIHDALQQKKKPLAAVMATMKVPAAPLPAVMHASQAAAMPKAAPARRAHESRMPYVFWGLLAVVCLFSAWPLFTAARFMNVQPAHSSPLPAAPKTFPERHPVRTFATTPTAISAGFTLSGIIDGNEELAVINDEVVGVGDRIGNALVKEIQGRRVILESQGREVYLTLA
ncbi:MAG TPA: hypothetical protein VL688_08350 [Verrucomicrobiae bacterium]|nr:hypothetical protein [Verrucomicrobiae bacterium]